MKNLLGLPDRTSSGSSKGPRAAAPPQPVEATTTTLPPSVSSAGWSGLSESSGPDTGFEPPDPWVGVGPDQVVQTTNDSMRITDRQNGTPTATALSSFFLLPGGIQSSDPRVIYDALHGRWILTQMSWDCVPGLGAAFGHGYLDYAISKTAKPTTNPNDWIIFFFRFNDFLMDYPGVGTSTDKIAVGTNLFSLVAGVNCANGPFATTDYLFIDWADVITLGGTDGFINGRSFSSAAYFTPRPAVQAPATSPTLFSVIGKLNLGTYEPTVLTWGGSAVAGTIAPTIEHHLREEDIASDFVDPPALGPQQPGPDTVTTAIDLRPTDAIWQNGRLVWVSNTSCTPAGDGSARTCVRVTDVGTSAMTVAVPPTLNQDFLVASVGQDNYMGGVGLAGNGTLHVVWTRSSTTAGDAPSSLTSYQPPGTGANTIGDAEVIVDSNTAYSGSRWGDYVGVAQDPQVPNQVWQADEYSGSDTFWATRVSPLQTGGATYVPMAPVRILDTRVGTGLSGRFMANSARTWNVAGVMGIAANAVAITGNVTVVGQQSAGSVSVTVTPTGSPPSSSINFPLGETRANNLVIPLSSSGTLSAVFKGTSGKGTHLVFDVTGYFLADTSGATFTPITPIRAIDTRTGTGMTGKFVANTPRTLVVAGTLGVPANATAVTGNVVIVQPSKLGSGAVTRDPTATPSTSTLNFPAHTNRANGVFAPLDGAGALSIVYNAAAGGTADVVLDLTGYFLPDLTGLTFVPLNPSRAVDTRPSAVLSGITGKLGTGVPKTLQVDGHWGVPLTAVAVTGNMTVTGSTSQGSVSATPDPDPAPTTSTINFVTGAVIANGFVGPLNGTGQMSFVYLAPTAGKTTDLVIDLSGYFQ